MKRTVIASFIGTAIEWYDFYIYGTAAALVFNKLALRVLVWVNLGYKSVFETL